MPSFARRGFHDICITSFSSYKSGFPTDRCRRLVANLYLLAGENRDFRGAQLQRDLTSSLDGPLLGTPATMTFSTRQTPFLAATSEPRTLTKA